MDALGLFAQLLLRNTILLLPLVVGWLSFRRLSMSRTSNAWIYALFCLFAAVIAAGLLPWSLGFEAPSAVFFVLAVFSPALWFGVTALCDGSRKVAYEDHIGDSLSKLKMQKFEEAPLVLNNPILEEPPVVMFRHAPRKAAQNASKPNKPVKLDVEVTPARAVKQEIVDAPRSVLEIARSMRRNKSSQPRRPKLLPSPENMTDLPFIRTR